MFKIDLDAINLGQFDPKRDHWLDFEVSSFFEYGDFYFHAIEAPLTVIRCQDLAEMVHTY